MGIRIDSVDWESRFGCKPKGRAEWSFFIPDQPDEEGRWKAFSRWYRFPECDYKKAQKKLRVAMDSIGAESAVLMT